MAEDKSINNSINDNAKTYLYRQPTPETYNILKGGSSQTLGFPKLSKDEQIKLKEEIYTIKRIISESTGEANIYEIVDKAGKYFALKLYRSFNDPKEDPNAEALERIKGNDLPGVLKLYDYGVRKREKYLGMHCFEISQLALGGEILAVNNFKEKYTLDFVKEKILPQVFAGIRALHEKRIIHCDLKPSNILYLDKEQSKVVIIDYGSAKTSELDSKKDLRQTSTVKGTDAYLAPELARGMVSPKADYHSLGMILLNLIYPEELTDNNDFSSVSRDKLRKLCEKQVNGKSIIIYSEAYNNINKIIDGLTKFHPQQRWDQENVTKWFEGKYIETEETQKGSISPLIIEDYTINSEIELAEFISLDNQWYEKLFENQVIFRFLKKWVSELRDSNEEEVFDQMIKYYSPIGKKYLKEAIVRFLNPKRSILINNFRCNISKSSNLKKEINDCIAKLDEVWKNIDRDEFKFNLFVIEFSLKQLIYDSEGISDQTSISLLNSIYSSFNLPCDELSNFNDYKCKTAKLDFSRETVFNKVPTLFYKFNPERIYNDHEGNQLNRIEDIIKNYIGNERLFANKYNMAELIAFAANQNISNLNYQSIGNLVFSFYSNSPRRTIKITRFKDNHKVNSIDIHYTISRSLVGVPGVEFSDEEASGYYRHRVSTEEIVVSDVFISFIGFINYMHDINDKTIEAGNKSELKKEISDEFKSRKKRRTVNLRTSNSNLPDISTNLHIAFRIAFYLPPAIVAIISLIKIFSASTLTSTAATIGISYINIILSLIPLMLLSTWTKNNPLNLPKEDNMFDSLANDYAGLQILNKDEDSFCPYYMGSSIVVYSIYTLLGTFVLGLLTLILLSLFRINNYNAGLVEADTSLFLEYVLTASAIFLFYHIIKKAPIVIYRNLNSAIRTSIFSILATIFLFALTVLNGYYVPYSLAKPSEEEVIQLENQISPPKQEVEDL